jgi:PLD-like domain
MIRKGLNMTSLIFNQKHLVKRVHDEMGSLDIAVAFWGKGAVEELGLQGKGPKTRILLDLSAGATNPSVVKKLCELYPDGVRSVNRLHAKAFVGSRWVAVGSANASANGLGLEGADARQWHELTLLTEEVDVVRQAKAWFQRQWNGAMPVDIATDYFKLVEQAWEENQKRRPRPNAGLDCLIIAAVKNPDAFRNRGWFVVVDLDDLSEEGADQLEKEEKIQGRPIFAWEDWSSIPAHSYLISITKFEGQRFRLDTHPGAPDPVYYSGDVKRGRMKYVTADFIPGFKGNIGKVADWLPSLRRAEREYRHWNSRRGLWMDLGEFAEKFGELRR